MEMAMTEAASTHGSPVIHFIRERAKETEPENE